MADEQMGRQVSKQEAQAWMGGGEPEVPTPVTGLLPNFQPVIDRVTALLDQFKDQPQKISMIMDTINRIALNAERDGLKITIEIAPKKPT